MKGNILQFLQIFTCVSWGVLRSRNLVNKADNTAGCYILLTCWLFHLLFPLMVGSSAVCCVTSLMAFLHLDLSLARLIFRCFLYISASFHLNFGLPRDDGPSTLKHMIFFVHDVSSCQYKWSDSLSLVHLRTFFSFFFFDWDSLHARLNSHYQTWSYKTKNHKKTKAYTKSV